MNAITILTEKAREIPTDQLVEVATLAHQLRTKENTTEHRIAYAAVMNVVFERFGEDFGDKLMDDLDAA